MTRLDLELWRRYREQGDVDARRALLDSYLGLVHHAAHELHRPRAATLDLADLIGAGTIGLVQALEGFDPGRGMAFSTYAMPRIRGAILDEIHTQDWAPRTVRVRRRALAQARAELQQQLGAPPSEQQMAERIGVNLPTYWKWLGEAEGRTLVALDQTATDSPNGRLHETIADEHTPSPGEELLRIEALDELRRGIGELPARDRLVLALYYHERLTLREIGELLHVTESRVSQIHSRALARLRRLLEER